MGVSKNRIVSPILYGVLTVAVIVTAYIGLLFANEYVVEIRLVGDDEIILEYGAPFEDPGASAVYYGTLLHREPLEVPVTAEDDVDTTKVGEYLIHYHAEHETITGEAVRKVRVVDTQPPEIILLGGETVTLPVGTAYQEPGYTAADNYDGDLTGTVAISGTVDSAVPGAYAMVYTVEDSSGNTAQAKRRVIYEDVTAPVITLTEGTTLEIDYGGVFVDPGATAADDCDADVTSLLCVEGTVDTTQPGAYSLVYTVSDSAGNIAKAERIVHVIDRIPPEITLAGENSVTVFVGDTYEDTGCLAQDNCDGELTSRVQITSNVNTRYPGTYTVTYTVSDSSGNSTEAERTVNVYRGVVYLTYDDGPSEYTSKLLDILDRYNVKATFFVVNFGYAAQMTRAAEAGHTIAIHSATHDYEKIYASEEAYFEDLYKMQGIIESHTGQTPMMLRFPGGSSNTRSWFNKGIMTRLTQLVEEKGFRYFDWNVSSMDAGGVTGGWREVAQNVIRGITCQRESVVLMHDSYSTCTRATERIIEWALANGYTFAALTYDGPGCHHDVNN